MRLFPFLHYTTCHLLQPIIGRCLGWWSVPFSAISGARQGRFGSDDVPLHSWFCCPTIMCVVSFISAAPPLHAASLFQRKSGSLCSANLRDLCGLQLDTNPFSCCYWSVVSGDQMLPCHSLLLWSALRMYMKYFFASSSSEDDLLWIPVLDRGQQTIVSSSVHHKCGLKLKVQSQI